MTFRTYRLIMLGVSLCFGAAAFFETELRVRVLLAVIGIAILFVAWKMSSVLIDPNSESTLLEGLESAILSIGPKQIVVYANPQSKILFGYTGPNGVTLNHFTLSPELDRLTKDAREAREPHEFELSLPGIPPRTVIARSWYSAETNLVHLELQDVTQLRHLERVRKDFVANVSHELRTPLTSIRAMAEIVQESGPEDEELVHRYGDKIVHEVDRLTHIVSDLLTLSTAESRDSRREVCDAAELARDAIHNLEAKAQAKGLQLQSDIPAQLSLYADPVQLSQVLINLLENAVNYTPEGFVRLEMTQDGSDLVFSVKDSGMGIDAEHLPRIFERFYRVDKGRSRATGGTGLGLSIVKHLVESHGGQIWAESKPGEGSTFHVRVPLNMLDKIPSN